jgi:hypothetical protein
MAEAEVLALLAAMAFLTGNRETVVLVFLRLSLEQL